MKRTTATCVAAVLAIALAAGSAQAAVITLDAFTDGASTALSGGNTVATLTGFDATASDKLVVLVGGASGAGLSTGFTASPVITSVTYNGVSMIEAIQANSSDGSTGSGRATGIFYLDSASFSGAGDIVVTYAQNLFTSSGFDIGAFALSGTATGVDAVGSSLNSGSAGLTVGSAGSFVVAANSFDGSVTGSLTALGTDDLVRGYDEDVAAGAYTATFSGGSTFQATTVASFTPIPEPASLAMGLAALGMFAARRRATK